MSSGIQLIVGLANPGREYENTRHNAGAWFVEAIAREHHLDLRMEAKFHGVSAHLSHCHLLIPTTFMNLSGQSVQACARFHKILPNAILVAHDDIDLPVGTVKLKYDGGDGGHNGLKDIIRHLHTKQFYRLRIGVGHPGNRKDVVDYVLDQPSKADKEKIMQGIEIATDLLPKLLAGDIQKAMQQLHTPKE